MASEGANSLRAKLLAWDAPRLEIDARAVRLMLAERTDEPFDDPEWIFEIKYDGFRILGGRTQGVDELFFRHGGSAHETFPEIHACLGSIKGEGFVLDGEIVILDRDGRPNFQRLQKRLELRQPLDIRRAASAEPATYFVFDFLGFEEFDLRALPLWQRKECLRMLIPFGGSLRIADHIDGNGKDFFAAVRKLGIEGIVAKRRDSPYLPGRTPLWLKIRSERVEDFVIVGFSRPAGRQSGIGALDLAYFQGGELVYAGRVGTGFSRRELASLHARLASLMRVEPSLFGPVPIAKTHEWVEPALVCEVRFLEWTNGGMLRQPVFLRIRDDKRPEECVVQRDTPAHAAREREGSMDTRLHPKGTPAQEDTRLHPEGTPAQEDTRLHPEGTTAQEDTRLHPEGTTLHRDNSREPQLTNLDKVFWPDEGYTKGDLVAYYHGISPWLLPYLRDRPVVLTRFPDGIFGKSFFQKDARVLAPEWIRTERLWSEHAQRTIDYFVCDNLESLLFIINLGTIPLHVWSSRVEKLDRPDWCILDLDPKGAPFSHVVRIAQAIRELAHEILLPAFLKTSGQEGLHVLLPLGAQWTYEQSRTLGILVANLVAKELPDLATTERVISRRAGRVYVDALQNGFGRLLVAPFSARPVKGGTVSMPLSWDALNERLDPKSFTLRSTLSRITHDPMRAVLESIPDLTRALSRLEKRMAI